MKVARTPHAGFKATMLPETIRDNLELAMAPRSVVSITC